MSIKISRKEKPARERAYYLREVLAKCSSFWWVKLHISFRCVKVITYAIKYINFSVSSSIHGGVFIPSDSISDPLFSV